MSAGIPAIEAPRRPASPQPLAEATLAGVGGRAWDYLFTTSPVLPPLPPWSLRELESYGACFTVSLAACQALIDEWHAAAWQKTFAMTRRLHTRHVRPVPAHALEPLPAAGNGYAGPWEPRDTDSIARWVKPETTVIPVAEADTQVVPGGTS